MTDPPSLPSALADLASAAGDRPLALTGIEERARRVRLRRGAGRAAIVTVCCAGLATGIALAGAGGSQVYRISASVPAPMLLDRCTAISAMAPTDAASKGAGVPGPASPNVATGAKVATGLPQIGGQFKAPGTVTGVPARDAVTIVVAAPLYSTPQKVSFAITAQTAFRTGGQPSGATILRAGSQIGFVATRTGPDAFRLELIDTNPDALSQATRQQPETTNGLPDEAASAKAAAVAKGATTSGAEPGPPPVGGTLKGKGTVVAVSVGAASLDIKGGPLAGQTLALTVTPATQFSAAGRQCDPSGLPAGTPMGFTATRTGATAYRLDQLNM
jgi:hypothetical protein